MKNTLLPALLTLLSIVSHAKSKSNAFIYYYDQKNGLYDYIIKRNDGKWEEMYAVKNKPRFHYKSISEQPDQTILYDEARKIYIRLSDNQYFSGDTKDNITHKEHDGYWSEDCNGPKAEQCLKNKQPLYFYENKECRGFFVQGKDNKWLEYTYEDKILLNTYNVVQKCSEFLLLSSNRGGYYMQLAASAVYYNATNDKMGFIHNYSGRWVKESISEIAKPISKGLYKNMAFAFYYPPEKTKYHSIYTPSTGDEWEEIRLKDRQLRFTYTLVSESTDEVVLYDPTRTVYVRLTEDESYWGSEKNNINNKIYEGNWINYNEGLPLVEVKAQDINVFAYENDDFAGYFIRANDAFWFSYSIYGGFATYALTIIEETKDYVLLYCGRGGGYYKLTKNALLKSKTRMGGYEELSKGEWTEGKIQNEPLPEPKK